MKITKEKGVKVTYSDGTVISTSVNPKISDKAVSCYFKVGKVFNIGQVEDKLVKIIKAEIL